MQLFTLALLTGTGITSALHVSTNQHSLDKFVIGTAALSNNKAPIEFLTAAYEKGFRRFDLARTYGLGKSEQIFGDFLNQQNHLVDEKELKIVTKGGMGNDKYGDPNREMLTFKGLKSELTASKAALGIESFDTYMYHRDDPRIPVKDLVLWMNDLMHFSSTSSQSFKRWGCSNWSLGRFLEAYYYALDYNLVPPSCNSPHFSLAAPSTEVWPTTFSVASEDAASHLKWYKDHNIDLYCWEVLAKGFMAVPGLWPEDDRDIMERISKTEEEYEIGSDEWRLFRIQRAYCSDVNYRRREAAETVANKHGYSIAQIAMLYSLMKSDNIHIICGAELPEHLDDMLAIQHLALCDDHMLALENGCTTTLKQLSEHGELSPIGV